MDHLLHAINASLVLHESASGPNRASPVRSLVPSYVAKTTGELQKDVPALQALIDAHTARPTQRDGLPLVLPAPTTPHTSPLRGPGITDPRSQLLAAELSATATKLARSEAEVARLSAELAVQKDQGPAAARAAIAGTASTPATLTAVSDKLARSEAEVSRLAAELAAQTERAAAASAVAAAAASLTERLSSELDAAGQKQADAEAEIARLRAQLEDATGRRSAAAPGPAASASGSSAAPGTAAGPLGNLLATAQRPARTPPVTPSSFSAAVPASIGPAGGTPPTARSSGSSRSLAAGGGASAGVTAASLWLDSGALPSQGTSARGMGSPATQSAQASAPPPPSGPGGLTASGIAALMSPASAAGGSRSAPAWTPRGLPAK